MKNEPRVLVVVKNGAAYIYQHKIKAKNINLIDMDCQDSTELEEVLDELQEAIKDFPKAARHLL